MVGRHDLALRRLRARHRTAEFRAGGESRRLEPQVFDLVALLVERQHRPVARDELIEVVWRGRIVRGDHSARINAARRAVGDSGGAQAVIRTLPRRSFRFVAQVEAVEGEPGNASEGGSQHVRFCRSRDETRIAYAISGRGPVLARRALAHASRTRQPDGATPPRRARTVVHARALRPARQISDWQVEDFSLEAHLADLEAVIAAAKLDRFVLYATPQGVPIAVRDARAWSRAGGAPDPARRIRSGEAGARRRRRPGAGGRLSRAHAAWLGPAGLAVPPGLGVDLRAGRDPEQLRSLVDLQKMTTTPENAVRLRRAFM